MDHRPSHTLLLKAARALELLIAAVILVVIVCAAGLLLWDTARTLVLSPGTSLWGTSSPAHCCW